jgi:ankyrin repeat protein
VIYHGADVNIPNHHQQSPLHLAALRGNLEIAGLLAENGASVKCLAAWNKDESAPMHLAFNTRSFEVVELLINHGVDVTAQDNNRSINTP